MTCTKLLIYYFGPYLYFVIIHLIYIIYIIYIKNIFLCLYAYVYTYMHIHVIYVCMHICI